MAAPGVPIARGPRFWLSRAAVLAAAVALGLLLQQVVGARLARIDALANEDVISARAELASLLRVFGTLLFGLTGATGLSILASSRRALVLGRFPPPGIWAWGASRVVTGARAVFLARTGLLLGALLIACSLAGGGLAWHMAALLLACKAR